MPDVQERLINCFNTVFPDLSRDEILRADTVSVVNWDSLATVTLIAVIEEEFDVTVAPEDFEHTTSFDSARQWLESKTSVSLGAQSQK